MVENFNPILSHRPSFEPEIKEEEEESDVVDMRS
jgi:hypothetical protein